jgi:hypothetical protein
MAQGDITTYNRYVQSLFDGNDYADLETDTIKVVVLKNTFTPDTGDASAQEFYSNISADQVVTGTAYTGPITLGTKSVTLSAGVATFDAADITIAQDVGGGFTDARYIVFYKDTGTPATSPLIAVGDLGGDTANTVAPVDFIWGSGGILTVQQV